jgi:hypothetical protein
VLWKETSGLFLKRWIKLPVAKKVWEVKNNQ